MYRIHPLQFIVRALCLLSTFMAATSSLLFADSINSPNITMNVDTNRSVGNGAGNTSVTVNTITVAETTLSEYSSGTGKLITIKAKPGYQFDSTSNVTAQSATIGINGGAVNAVATITPTGAANETLTFNFTSGTNTNVQDILRINGIKLKILSAVGAAGPAQTTLAFTSSAAGGAFTDQGIVAASITRGAADHLTFSQQPGSNVAGANIFPELRIVDFGGNLLTNTDRAITLSISTNPGSATLLGTTQLTSASGVAKWTATEGLNITTAAEGYLLQASQGGTNFLTSNSATSSAFNISAGDPGGLVVLTQPANTVAGGDITLSIQTIDEFDNPTTVSGIAVTLDSSVSTGGWPLVADSSLTKTTGSDGIVTWATSDHLRINKLVSNYQLQASGLGAPITTDPFNVATGPAALVRFVQQPTDSKEETTFNPAVTAEIVDALGNRVDTTATISLSVFESSCVGALSGASAAAVSGIATFPALVLDAPCSNVHLQGASTGLAGLLSDDFDVKAKDESSLGIKSLTLKRGKLFQFSASGTFTPSKNSIDNPTKKGASLSVAGSTGSVKYALPKSGWKKKGSGFTFSGPKCESVVIKKNAVSAKCKSRTGSISLPETDVDVVLSIGKGTQKVCGECGGIVSGVESKILKRTSCDAPSFCP